MHPLELPLSWLPRLAGLLVNRPQHCFRQFRSRNEHHLLNVILHRDSKREIGLETYTCELHQNRDDLRTIILKAKQSMRNHNLVKKQCGNA